MHKVDCVIIPYLRVYYQLLVQLGKCILYNGPDWMTACEHTNQCDSVPQNLWSCTATDDFVLKFFLAFILCGMEIYQEHSVSSITLWIWLDTSLLQAYF